MRPYFKFILILTIVSLLPSGCNELCDWYEQQYLEQCQAQTPNVVGGNVGNHYQKTATVWRYEFNTPGSSNDNCDLKFLETKQREAKSILKNELLKFINLSFF